ncbi:8853_t:CDS:1, partial [Ambispora gerdemannii]
MFFELYALRHPKFVTVSKQHLRDELKLTMFLCETKQLESKFISPIRSNSHLNEAECSVQIHLEHQHDSQ